MLTAARSSLEGASDNEIAGIEAKSGCAMFDSCFKNDNPTEDFCNSVSKNEPPLC